MAVRLYRSAQRACSTAALLFCCLVLLVQLSSGVCAAPIQNELEMEAVTVDITAALNARQDAESESAAIEDVAPEPTAGPMNMDADDRPEPLPVASIATKPGAACPFYDLQKDFGAVGNNVAKDTAAFQAASAAFNKAKCGTLHIPKATYIVSGQRPRNATEDRTRVPFYVYDGVFNVAGLTKLAINGHGATVKLAPGLKYGGFDPDTGKAMTERTTAALYSARVGPILQVWNSADVSINNLIVHGNNEELDTGGPFGDKGWQSSGHGIVYDACRGCSISGCTVTNCALDGIAVQQGSEKDPNYNPVKIDNTLATLNGRQGLSWIGGNGLTVTNSRFIKTGRAKVKNTGGPFVSAPGAGIDIEPNSGKPQWTRGGQFTNVETFDNAGAGLLVVGAEVDGGHATFDRCIFHGTSSYAATVYGPGVVIKNSVFYGMVQGSSNGTMHGGSRDTALATKLSNCTFTDTATGRPSSAVFTGTKADASITWLVYSAGGGVVYDKCTWIVNKVQSVSGRAAGDTVRQTFNDCTFIHGDTNLAIPAQQAEFNNVALRRCTFTETPQLSAADPTQKRWVIYQANTTADADTQIVDSSRKAPSRVIKWFPGTPAQA